MPFRVRQYPTKKRPEKAPMNHSSIVGFIFVGASLITGCAASVDGQGSSEQTASSSETLTVAQCASQRTTCVANNPLFGLFTCPLQYNQCVATASNGLPAQVNSAIADAAACTKTALACTNDATTPAAVASCATTE